MEEGGRRLSVTSLVVLFLLGIGVCAVFFSLGFLLGYKERASDDAAAVEHVMPPSESPPVVNPPASKEETGFARGATPRSAGPTARLPARESGPNGQNAASSAYTSDAGSRAAPVGVRGSAAMPGGRVPSPTPGSPSTRQPVTGGIVLQVSALGSVEDAQRLAKVLKERGYPVFLATPQEAHADDNLYRVRVGPFMSRDEAEKTRQKLVTQGFKPFVAR